MKVTGNLSQIPRIGLPREVHSLEKMRNHNYLLGFQPIGIEKQ